MFVTNIKVNIPVFTSKYKPILPITAIQFDYSILFFASTLLTVGSLRDLKLILLPSIASVLSLKRKNPVCPG